MGHHFLHHHALLVHLDGVHPAVLARVPGGLDGLGKTLVQLIDAGMQQVAETQQHRHIRAALLQPLHDIRQAHLLRAAVRIHQVHIHLARSRHTEVIITPVIDPVQFGRIGGCPVADLAFDGFFAGGHSADVLERVRALYTTPPRLSIRIFSAGTH